MSIDDLYKDLKMQVTLLLERENLMKTDRYNLTRELDDLRA